MRKTAVAASVLVLVIGLVPLLTAMPAGAGGAGPVIVVTTNVDELNGTGDNVISIREAVGLAATDGVATTVAIPPGEYLLTRCAAMGAEDENANVNGDLDQQTVTEALSLVRTSGDGGVARIEQTCAGERIVDSLAEVALGDVELLGGTPAGAGGAVRTGGAVTAVRSSVHHNETGSFGGGLFAGTSVTLIDSSLQRNAAAADGGAIRASDAVTLLRSEVLKNEASGGGGGIRALGGGDVSLTESTVGRNVAGTVGGIYLDAGAAVVLEDATVAENVTTGGSVGGIFAGTQVVAAQSTIADNRSLGGPIANVNTSTFSANETVVALAEPANSCIVNTGSSDGSNVEEGGTSCGFDDMTDFSNTGDPGLLPLFDNGGPTVTMFLRSTSFLRDLVPTTSNSCFNGGTDQRGIDRPQGSPCDVGAVEVQPCGAFFGDVSGTHPFCWEIGWMSAAGITTGFPGTPPTYQPSSPVTRQSMSAFLFRLAGSPDVAVPMTPTFGDVGTTHPFYDEIEWMAGQGITTGFPGTPKPTYRPSTVVSRQSMSAFMFRFIDAGGAPPPVATFADVSTGHPFFEEIEWMAAEGITTGFPGNLFKPSAAVTRQSMSAFMFRLAPLLAVQES